MQIAEETLIFILVGMTVLIIEYGAKAGKVILSGILGIASLFILHGTTTAIPINIFTFMISGILGIPGVIAMEYSFVHII